MSILSKSLMALGLAALMVAPASAQERRGPGGPGGGMMGGRSLGGLLANAGVQEELKLDDAQKSKAAEVAGKARDKFAPAREALQNLGVQERFAKSRTISREADAEILKGLADVLKPEQVARLKGIHYRSQGVSAFEDEDLQKALSLTADQKSAVEKAVADYDSEVLGAFQGDRESAMSKISEIRKEALSKVEAKLTAEQKAEYAKLIGAPFEVRFEGRGPGGGRNR